MTDGRYLDHLLHERHCEFKRLDVTGMDNIPILRINDPEMVEQETCLFFPGYSTGDQYVSLLHREIQASLELRQAMPVVRFADGEYAFYANRLNCNGLYSQAESVASIKQAIPGHIEGFKQLAASGKIAPLIFPGNVRRKHKGILHFFRTMHGDDAAVQFIDFLYENKIKLTEDNYIPFYAVYAYLTSRDFGTLVNGKQVCIISSECNQAACAAWFASRSSTPEVFFVKIPESYVATRWEAMRNDIIGQVPSDTDICLVGAGVGSLLVCVDVAGYLSIPAIDAGHIVNMMNNQEAKSNGPRLYTMYRQTCD